MDNPLPSRFAPAGRKPNGILGVVLADGRATRMGGGDKSLLQLGGMSLLEHVLARLEPQCRVLAISANGDPARFSRFGYPVLADSVPAFAGPLAGILSGLDWAAENQAEAIVTVAADTPFLPDDLVMRLREAAATKRAAIALAASPDAAGLLRRHPTCGLWPVALREPLRADLVAGSARPCCGPTGTPPRLLFSASPGLIRFSTSIHRRIWCRRRRLHNWANRRFSAANVFRAAIEDGSHGDEGHRHARLDPGVSRINAHQPIGQGERGEAMGIV